MSGTFSLFGVSVHLGFLASVMFLKTCFIVGLCTILVIFLDVTEATMEEMFVSAPSFKSTVHYSGGRRGS